MSEEKTYKEAMILIEELRTLGYAITVFMPCELGTASNEKVEDRMCEAGSDMIEYLEANPNG